MIAIEEEYDSSDDKHGIVCTQDYVVVDYQRIGDRTSHIFKQNHQIIQDL